MKEFLTFRSFYTNEEAAELSETLTQKDITNRIYKSRELADKVIVGDNLPKQYHVQLYQEDFTRANDLLDELVTKNLSSIEDDYYLFSFTDEELFEIINKPDEWNNQDVVLARAILKERGKEISDKEMAKIKRERYATLAKSEKVSSTSIIGWYITAFLIPPVAIIIGLLYLNAKTLLPDGRRSFSYDEWTRQHARNIIIIGSILTVVFIFDNMKTHFVFNFF